MSNRSRENARFIEESTPHSTKVQQANKNVAADFIWNSSDYGVTSESSRVHAAGDYFSGACR